MVRSNPEQMRAGHAPRIVPILNTPAATSAATTTAATTTARCNQAELAQMRQEYLTAHLALDLPVVRRGLFKYLTGLAVEAKARVGVGTAQTDQSQGGHTGGESRETPKPHSPAVETTQTSKATLKRVPRHFRFRVLVASTPASLNNHNFQDLCVSDARLEALLVQVLKENEELQKEGLVKQAHQGNLQVVSALQAKSLSLAAGSQQLGVSVRTAQRRRKQGVPRRVLVAPEHQIFVELLKGDLKSKEIAAKYGVTAQTVTNIRTRVLDYMLWLIIQSEKFKDGTNR
ncbi:MAG TPA: hypothetical protein VH186_15625 [Chloroflexia bacterium]|nr:hypothetical protein [Chloroflexia bacterium]